MTTLLRRVFTYTCPTGSGANEWVMAAGRFNFSRKSSAISSTSGPRERVKRKEYFGPRPSLGTMTRFSERNCGSRGEGEAPRSIVWGNAFQFLRPAEAILSGHAL